MLPTTADGTPLCDDRRSCRREPHAWVKLWKHHAAQPEADRINAVAAAERGEPWLPRYGGKISSEWFFSKSLQILDEAPDIYAAADRLIEAADWVVWQLTGVETRNSCTAGYKAIWSKRGRLPATRTTSPRWIPRFADVVDDKMSRDIRPIGERAGGLTAEAAALDGPARRARRWPSPTSTRTCRCRRSTRHRARTHGRGHGHEHLPHGAGRPAGACVEGMCGVVEDGIIPGLFGYEAGQSGVGDIFAWFVDNAVPPEYHEAAAARGHRRPRRPGARGARSCGRASPVCWRSTGGTATARSSSTST